jgi:predicted MFS family arabinose efflux permease
LRTISSATDSVKIANTAVILLSCAAFVVTVDIRVVSPMLRAVADEFRADIGTTGLVVTAYAVPYGLFQLVYGPLADRFGKLRIISFALFAFAIGAGICVTATKLIISSSVLCSVATESAVYFIPATSKNWLSGLAKTGF